MQRGESGTLTYAKLSDSNGCMWLHCNSVFVLSGGFFGCSDGISILFEVGLETFRSPILCTLVCGSAAGTLKQGRGGALHRVQEARELVAKGARGGALAAARQPGPAAEAAVLARVPAGCTWRASARS